MNVLRILDYKNWESDRQSLLLSYKIIITSKIDYACIAFASACKWTFKLLDTINKNAFRKEQCYSEAGEPSLKTRREILNLSHATSEAADMEKFP
ncbi:hypothetical protein HHI36_006122 [Cryptolaemus montrouzieri]|uniref:Uncharacterized protein n=1 Tax=Cryptolaemus montrouzieri TaxID=559131 RepID=A0ABD2NWB2_9CUCU